MIEIFKTIRLFLTLWIPYFVKFIPRSKKIWIYGGRNGKFVDNTKYWFLWTTENLPEISHVWISSDKETIKLLRNHGFSAYSPFTVKGLYYLLRAKIVFYTHGATSVIRPVFLEGAVKFDFFHGIPLKTLRMEKSRKFYNVLEKNFSLNLYKNLYKYYKTRYYKNDYIVIPSKLHEEQFEDHTGERLFFGYPRNMVFQVSAEKLQNLMMFSDRDTELYKRIKKYRRKYIYMPTFREGSPDFVQDAFPDVEKLNDVMEKQNAVFMLKLHPYTKTKLDFSSYPNLLIVDNEIDIYPFMPLVDCLISDYSSISLDFYFARKPVVFYVFDLDSFVGESRDLDFHPQKLAPESTAINWNQLIELLGDFSNIPLLDSQPGKYHFDSLIKTDLKALADHIKMKILKIPSSS